MDAIRRARRAAWVFAAAGSVCAVASGQMTGPPLDPPRNGQALPLPPPPADNAAARFGNITYPTPGLDTPPVR